MMILIYLFILAVIYYLGYVLSLYSWAAYLESEELEEILATLGKYRKIVLGKIIDNPRISIQIAIVFKSFALVAASMVGVLIGKTAYTGSTSLLGFPCILCLICVWLLYLVFVEYLPRRKVLKATEKDIVKFLPLFAVVYIIFWPFLWLYGRIFSREGREKISDDQKEDIIERAIETLAEQSGVDEPIIEEDEKEMIGQIFQLDVTEVREVMVPRVNIKAVDKTAGFDEIRDLTKEYGFSRYPVYEGTIDKIIGILYVKDLFTEPDREHDKFDITSRMRKPYLVPETKIISDLLAEFKATKTHIAIAVDEYGGTAGLVTLEDILEEIVGEIQDEHDSETAPLIRLSDNSFRVDAAMMVEDLVDELNLEYDIQGFETVGGLIYDLVGSVPTVGARIKWKDMILEVTKVEGQRIISLRTWIKKNPES
jgi:putative hemolysin